LVRSLDRRSLPVFLDALVLFYRFGRDGRGRFRGVVLLNVSCGSGDGSPSLATTDADYEGANDECAKHKFQYVFHCVLVVL